MLLPVVIINQFVKQVVVKVTKVLQKGVNPRIQQTNTCSKLAIETLEKVAKYI